MSYHEPEAFSEDSQKDSKGSRTGQGKKATRMGLRVKSSFISISRGAVGHNFPGSVHPALKKRNKVFVTSDPSLLWTMGPQGLWDDSAKAIFWRRLQR